MGQKLCAFYQKCGAFWVKKIVRFFVLFLAKVGAPLSSKLLKTLIANWYSAKFQTKKYNLQSKMERKLFRIFHIKKLKTFCGGPLCDFYYPPSPLFWSKYKQCLLKKWFRFCPLFVSRRYFSGLKWLICVADFAKNNKRAFTKIKVQYLMIMKELRTTSLKNPLKWISNKHESKRNWFSFNSLWH